ncbi:carbon-nitrogen family hydrolase [Barrientosiimonas marina]|uniref:Nitrilase-related carbon-nitrogen hydrolase n=1 Tax=Lentibacillus kimchii TaxID=1542911 RepID=A0ABW2UV43_9BACI
MTKKIALIQMDITYGDPKVNFAHVSKWVTNAAYMGVDIIVLPELWDTGFDLEQMNTMADRDANATTEFLSDLAKQMNIAILGGSIAEEINSGMKNTMLIIDRNGERIHKYSKEHLSESEQPYLLAGEAGNEFELDGILSAGFIGADIRFPKRLSETAENGAKVIYVVAQWTEDRINEWKTTVQSCAVDNQCYVIACNRTGSDPDNVYGGMSLVVDPKGGIIAEGGNDEKMILAEISVDKDQSGKQ